MLNHLTFRPGAAASRGHSGTLPVKSQAISADSDSFVESSVEEKSFGQSIKSFTRRLFKGSRWAELQDIKSTKKRFASLSKPAQFQAQTQKLKDRLEKGADFDDIRVEAYALASRACEVATGMNPYECQVMGAISLGKGEIAEMMTGEGKTLTAVMPLYLHALAGKGSQLVTVNDTLAQRDAQEMGPIFELLGLSVGTVLESMTPEEKRLGYAADVTYTTDRALGFDYLRDRTVKSLDERVQREPFFALVDEVDEVLLDEARTPLIISGPADAPTEEYHRFDDIVEQLKPGVDYFVDRDNRQAWLSELGTEFVENELYGDTLDGKDALSLANYHRKAGALRKEGKTLRALQQHEKKKPSLISRLSDDTWSKRKEELQEQYTEASQKTDSFGHNYNLYDGDHSEQVRVLNATLKAHALFEEGLDYIVQDGKVKIVDENKGRTSRGRRFNEGLHQALEAKSDVALRPESKPVASITYPNLFKHYPHLAGMSGTAKTSEPEFQELYDLNVTKIPTNLQFKTSPNSPESAPRHARIDEPDSIFSTKKEKFAAVVAEAIQAFHEGIPVLVGTLSVEANNYLHAQLLKQGIAPGAIQVLNAEHVRGDKSLENSIIAQAGRSGMITLATNMAGRGVNIKPDFVNYKKMAMEVESQLAQGKPFVEVQVQSEKEAGKMKAWLATFDESQVQLRIGSEDSGAANVDSRDFPTGGLYVIGTERAKSRRIDDQLIGRAARQGNPGRSKFFLSLEDDLVKSLAENDMDSALKFLAETGVVESKTAYKLVRKSQIRLAEMSLHAREQGDLYDETMDIQRESFYALREGMLDPQSDLRGKLTEDSLEYVSSELMEGLGKKGKLKRSDVESTFESLSRKLKLKADWLSDKTGLSEQDSTLKRREVVELAMKAIREELEAAYQEFDHSAVKLDDKYRQSLLQVADDQWSDHLEVMSNLQKGVQWVGQIGEKPEDAYKRRGIEAFEGTLLAMRDQSVEDNLAQVLVGASMLKSERQKSA